MLAAIGAGLRQPGKGGLTLVSELLIDRAAAWRRVFPNIP